MIQPSSQSILLMRANFPQTKSLATQVRALRRRKNQLSDSLRLGRASSLFALSFLPNQAEMLGRRDLKRRNRGRLPRRLSARGVRVGHREDDGGDEWTAMGSPANLMTGGERRRGGFELDDRGKSDDPMSRGGMSSVGWRARRPTLGGGTVGPGWGDLG